MFHSIHNLLSENNFIIFRKILIHNDFQYFDSNHHKNSIKNNKDTKFASNLHFF